MHPSHTAEKWGAGVGAGVWLAHVALVQPLRLISGEFNTHRQLGYWTQCCLKGEEKVREGKKGYTEWPRNWGTTEHPTSGIL